MNRKRLILFMFTSCFFGISAHAAIGREPIPDDILDLRDPFKRPAAQSIKKQLKSILETYVAESFKVVAIMTGPKKIKAMILTPTGESFFVSEKAKIGTKGGFIRKITPDSIIIQESSVNLLGQTEKQDIELKIGAVNDSKPNSMPTGQQGE